MKRITLLFGFFVLATTLFSACNKGGGGGGGGGGDPAADCAARNQGYNPNIGQCVPYCGGPNSYYGNNQGYNQGYVPSYNRNYSNYSNYGNYGYNQYNQYNCAPNAYGYNNSSPVPPGCQVQSMNPIGGGLYFYTWWCPGGYY